MPHRALLLVLALAACADRAPTPPPAEAPAPPTPIEAKGGPTRITMHDVELVQPMGGLLRIRRLAGVMSPTKEGAVVRTDDPSSYAIHIDAAEVALDWGSLDALLSSADRKADGKKSMMATVHLGPDGERVAIEGTKPVPFRASGDVSVDEQGRLTITVTDVKALGIQTDGLRRALKLSLEDLIDTTGEEGVSVQGETIHLDPLADLPDPKVVGKITGASVEADGLVLRIGDQAVDEPEETASANVASSARTRAKNGLEIRGGTIRHGPVLISDVDLVLRDADPTDPMRLTTSEVFRQSTLGTSRFTEAGGLVIELPDWGEQPGG